MNFFGKKPARFDEEDSFYDTPVETGGAIEEVGAAEVTAVRSMPGAHGASMGFGGNSIELKVVRPDKFEDVATIADHLLNHCTVVLNLEVANKEVCRRLLDFLSGVAYSIGGQINRVAAQTYIITPSNVDVSESHEPAEDARNGEIQ